MSSTPLSQLFVRSGAFCWEPRYEVHELATQPASEDLFETQPYESYETGGTPQDCIDTQVYELPDYATQPYYPIELPYDPTELPTLPHEPYYPDEMSQSDPSTPRKQTRLEWSFDRGTAPSPAPSEAPTGDDDKWAASEPAFKKLRSASSPQQWRDFQKAQEEARQQSVREAEELVAGSVR